MEHMLPYNLEEYCRVFEISFFNVHMKCLFCKFDVSTLDLAGFYCKQLRLVWRDAQCFACCLKCLRVLAKHEFENYCICVCKGSTLEFLTKKGLAFVIVRCIDCLTLLDYAEKLECDRRGLPFCLVRTHWRNLCRNCMKKDDWERGEY
uniref:Protein E6 n=1 Tax=Human papillomavirus TaxID=10566 RepID=A0A385PIR2_9PAPI|nr:MAG: E6 protein [Human papillomavirus]